MYLLRTLRKSAHVCHGRKLVGILRVIMCVTKSNAVISCIGMIYPAMGKVAASMNASAGANAEYRLIGWHLLILPIPANYRRFQNRRDYFAFGQPTSAARRKSVGVIDVRALNARLKGPNEPYPSSSAIVNTGVRARSGSASSCCAAAIR